MPKIPPAAKSDDKTQMKVGLPPPQNRRVLIVEDQAVLLEGMASAFERAGRSVVAERTFEQARSRLLAENFHCLITDVRLGAFNGIQLAVIARDRNPDMGIIVFSGFDDPVLRAEAAQLGARYVLKPVTAARLMELLDAC
ncbi:MAG TPA: response regulator [Vicinamibacterales bacterium]|nr:response regulator [Vicinamibacterales bacterium]